MTRLIAILALLSTASLTPVFGEENDIFFNSLKTEDGLSHHTVASIYEDENGFIWIGTREGLNLYNGDNIRVFKAEDGNPNSLLYDSVTKICGNGDGVIYLQGSQGVAAYDIRKDRFEIIMQENVSTITFHDSLYIAIEDKIYTYDGFGTSIRYDLGKPGIRINTLRFIDGDMWAGTDKDGIFILPEKKRIDIGYRIMNIYPDSKGNIWICTSGNGLLRYNNGEISSIGGHHSREIVRECCEDSLGDMWVATSEGLKRYSSETGKISEYYPEAHAGSLNHISITCIISDRAGNIWLGSYFGGVNYFNPQRQTYTLYRQGETEAEGLSFPVIGKVTEDTYGRIWIGTEGGGVNCIDRKTGKIRWLTTKNSRLPSDNIKSLYSNGNMLWIGTHNGLVRYDTVSGNMRVWRHDSADPASLPSRTVSDIIPYNGKLLVSTFGGICFIDPKTGEVERLPEIGGTKIGYTTDLHLSADSLLWIVTGENVFSYDITDRVMTEHFDGNEVSPGGKHSITLCVFEDSSHDIYAATWGNGLYRFDRISGVFVKFATTADGLLSDCIYGIVEVAPGKLLLSCNSGYSLIDTRTHSISCYSSDTGMPVSSFNEYSLFRSSDGEIFMGSVDGLLSFREYENKMKSGSRIIPYSLIVNNREVRPGDGTGILSETLQYTKEIRLKGTQNVFSLRFTTLNYTHEREDIYYCLKHFSDEWINTNGSKTITYSK